LPTELKVALEIVSQVTGLRENDLIVIALATYLSNPEMTFKTRNDKYLH
jgi:hypothetical protein